MEDKIYNTRAEYYKDHRVCPKCRKIPSSTYAGFVFTAGRAFKDENKCICECGWTGITDDLIKNYE